MLHHWQPSYHVSATSPHLHICLDKQGLVPPYLYSIQRDRESGLYLSYLCESALKLASRALC